MKFDRAEAAQMQNIQGDLERVLLPYRENTEAGVAAFAAVRIARTLLEKYPDSVRRQLLEEVVIPFLRGETKAPGLRDSGLLTPHWSSRLKRGAG